MQAVLLQFSAFAIALGSYLLLALAFPELKHRSWRNDPAGLVASVAVFAILLGTSRLGIARPYTLIAALTALCVGYVILARKPTELLGLLRPLLRSRRAIIVLVLVNIVVALTCLLLAWK